MDLYRQGQVVDESVYIVKGERGQLWWVRARFEKGINVQVVDRTSRANRRNFITKLFDHTGQLCEVHVLPNVPSVIIGA